MIRVGFVFAFDDGWLGGINYFRNLLTALYSFPERKIEAVIFTGYKTPEIHLADFPAISIVRSRMFDKGTFLWRLRHMVRYRLWRDFLFEWLLKSNGISVLSHSDWIKGNVGFPTIGWIPDFQHVHLPEFFSANEIAARNKHYSDLCRHCTTVIVSSVDAQSDLSRFDPACTSKSEVLQFVVASAKPESSLPCRGELEERYQFSGKYFLLPNQFWKHKNHRVVIEALSLLGREGKRVLVLTTGNTADYRHPEFFKSLLDRVVQLGVAEDFRHLGLVPPPDLAGLMRDALAIINPSFFEGWSTTVEEAKALGKQVILSDIAVHREQDPARGRYFPPHDDRALAALFWEFWSTPEPDNSISIESSRHATDKRRLNFARRYQSIVLKTLGHH